MSHKRLEPCRPSQVHSFKLQHGIPALDFWMVWENLFSPLGHLTGGLGRRIIAQLTCWLFGNETSGGLLSCC